MEEKNYCRKRGSKSATTRLNKHPGKGLIF